MYTDRNWPEVSQKSEDNRGIRSINSCDKISCRLLVHLNVSVANSFDPDQTGSSLIRAHAVCIYADISP